MAEVETASAHRQVLQSVVGELRQEYPGCAILLAGSLMRGTEHAGSDIDLFAVFFELGTVAPPSWGIVHSAPTVKVLQRAVQEIPVCCTAMARSLLETMLQKPWRNRLFAQAEVLCDPGGYVGRCQAGINQWFASHPAVDALWDNQEQEHQRCKAALRQGQPATMRFPSWDAFADHVDRLVRGPKNG